jgi:aspartyl-tRNA(Asn)/glutamyl-tRNA(Gln) amidotransferase subunit B
MTDDRAKAEYFEATVAAGAPAKQAANWIMGDISAYLNANANLSINDLALKPKALAELIGLIESNTISTTGAKTVLPILLTEGGSPMERVEAAGLIQISDTGFLDAAIAEVLEAYPKELEMYRGGKTKMLGFFVGQVMKKTGGRADPKLTNQLLSQKLNG